MMILCQSYYGVTTMYRHAMACEHVAWHAVGYWRARAPGAWFDKRKASEARGQAGHKECHKK